MSEGTWRPIETAPRDGDDFLATNQDGFMQVVGFDDSMASDWIWSVADGATYHKSAFTHWMPLPELPSALAKAPSDTPTVEIS